MGKQQEKYTIEDYYNWPEDEMIELIDGVIYEMDTPKVEHQRMIEEISYTLQSYARRKKRDCEVFAIPIDVRLDCDDYTMVVPDITIVCKPEKLKRQYIDGAPDFVVEVLSPDTRKKDMIIKVQKYANAGVREYWIVDLEKEWIIVYELCEEGDQENIMVQFYDFESKVPVGIFAGECIIDFKEIKEYLED